MGRGKAAKTVKLENTLFEILSEYNPMTVRQAYYQLVSRQEIENSQSQYDKIGRILVEMRKAGTIPWEWIEDRNRRPRSVSMWADLKDFGDTVCRAYRRDTWKDQPQLVEVWLEKDALSGIFQDILEPYGITLNVGRGYDGWSSIHWAAERYQEWGGPVSILYFGDHDPSGEDMFRSLRERLAFFQSSPEMRKCAVTREDIHKYNLPPDFTKSTDTRQKGFIAQYGDMAVELDALPRAILENRIKENVLDSIDLGAVERIRDIEAQERGRLVELINSIG